MKTLFNSTCSCFQPTANKAGFFSCGNTNTSILTKGTMIIVLFLLCLIVVINMLVIIGLN